jgi:very-short-patch-repair endonuclease
LLRNISSKLEGRGEGNKMTTQLHTNARRLRKNQTDAERYMWYLLRGDRLRQYKFRRQHPIEPYIVDFICISKRLIIELDGGQHAEAYTYDKKRTAFLGTKGYKVLRFWNNEILQETEGVLSIVFNKLEFSL